MTNAAIIRDRLLIAASFVFVIGVLGHGCAGPVAAQAAPEISGEAFALDGDTISVGKHRIRLFGIDAPELRQRCREKFWPQFSVECGRDALTALDGILKAGNRRVTCRAVDRDDYGRIVAVCRAGKTDLAEAMAENGQALAYTRYRDRDPERSDAYLEAEHRAIAAKCGLWALDFDTPWDWRHAR